MIASRAGLAVLAAIAVALAVAIAVAPGAPPPVDHALVPGFDARFVLELRWTRGGTLETWLARSRDGWIGVDPKGRADDATVSAALAALRGARWHREAPASVAGTPRAALTVNEGGVKLAIGDAIEGVDQSWLVTRGEAFLVDGWVARALDPGRLALYDRFPFAGAARARSIRIGEVELASGRAGQVLVDAARVRALVDALARLEYTGAPADSHAQPAMSIALDGERAVAIGRCAHAGVYVRAPIGDGCVPLDGWHEVFAEAEALRGPPAGIVERRPLPVAPVHVTLPGGGALDLVARPRLDGRDADPDRTAELLAALAQPAEAAVAVPAAKAAATLVADGTTLDLYAGNLVARRGEPVALRVAPAAWAVLARPALAYADPQRWAEDATAITSIAIDGKTYRRGEVVGEWPGARDPAVLEALAGALAVVRAPAGPPPAAIEHRLEVAFAPPAGAPSTHRLELGRASPQGCAATADGKPVALPPALCLAVLAASR
ncbi:MAG TPA: hypothetical protein VGF94_16235 [Kofleriaceae bacterium]